jgi:hypothetical protein
MQCLPRLLPLLLLLLLVVMMVVVPMMVAAVPHLQTLPCSCFKLQKRLTLLLLFQPCTFAWHRRCCMATLAHSQTDHFCRPLSYITLIILIIILSHLPPPVLLLVLPHTDLLPVEVSTTSSSCRGSKVLPLVWS